MTPLNQKSAVPQPLLPERVGISEQRATTRRDQLPAGQWLALHAMNRAPPNELTIE
jgi:hypothetical protein